MEERKKFKSLLATITHDFEKIDQIKEQIKESIGDAAQTYNLDKKVVRRLANTMYKHDYASRQQEEQHFRLLYETLIEGRLTAVESDDEKAA